MAGRCITPEPACGTGGSCTVFLSSQLHSGNLGGLAGADAICQRLADAADSLAPAGTYRAWLSDSTTSAAARLYHAAGPYVLVDGTVVAADWAALTNAQQVALQQPINQTERGQGLSVAVWTNTLPDGSRDSAETCLDWTSSQAAGWVRAGFSDMTSFHWTAGGEGTCPGGRGLYCVQQP